MLIVKTDYQKTLRNRLDTVDTDPWCVMHYECEYNRDPVFGCQGKHWKERIDDESMMGPSEQDR